MHVRDVSGSSSGFASIAITGTAWATGQMILNKVASVAATLVISRYLSGEEVAMATLVFVIVRFLSVLSPLTMSDVLISRGRQVDESISSASRTALLAGCLILVVVSVLAPMFASFYAQFPHGLLCALLVVAALRAIGDGAQIGPLTELRINFKNRELAVIDGSLQLVATVLGVVLAVLGAGAWSIVAPVSLASVGKAVVFRHWRRRMLRHLPHRESTGTRGTASGIVIRRTFVTVSGAHYIHGLFDALPVLLLGKFASEAATGLYAFGFNLSVQADSMIAGQISKVLQPVLNRLGNDSDRQIDGYLRTLRSLGAVSVPVCACQAVFADAFFKVCFEPRWGPAASVLSILSLGQAFFFANAPTMALLKAQGRFRLFFAWQSAHLFVSAILLIWAALCGGAIWVAVVTASLSACSLPLAVWFSIRSRDYAPWAVLKVLVGPWTTALPISLAAWQLSGWLSSLGTSGCLVDLMVLAPTTLAAMLWATRWSQPSTFGEMRPLAAAVLARLKRH